MRRRLAEQKTWTEPEPNQNGTLKSCCWVAGLIVVFWANLAWVVWYWYFNCLLYYPAKSCFSPRYPRSAVCSLKVKIFIFLIFLCISFPSFPAQRVHCSPFYYLFALSLRFQIWRWVQEWFPPRPWNSHLARWSDTQRESGCDGCAGHPCLLGSVSNAWDRWRQICGAAHGKNPVTPSRTEAASTRASGTMENRTLGWEKSKVQLLAEWVNAFVGNLCLECRIIWLLAAGCCDFFRCRWCPDCLRLGWLDVGGCSVEVLSTARFDQHLHPLNSTRVDSCNHPNPQNGYHTCVNTYIYIT